MLLSLGESMPQSSLLFFSALLSLDTADAAVWVMIVKCNRAMRRLMFFNQCRDPLEFRERIALCVVLVKSSLSLPSAAF